MPRVGEKIRCIKTWINPNPGQGDIVIGTEYDVSRVDANGFDIDIITNYGSLWGSVPVRSTLHFMNHEFLRYFEHIAQTQNSLDDWLFANFPRFFSPSKKCDCGFIKGVSAAHYSWCDLQKGPISA